ncbi:MAG: hypothetical protein ABSG50_15125 [Opitutaceae bacterium]|jgi:hypothetical protein
MKGRQNVPTLIYVACVLLAMVFWLVLISSKMVGFAKTLYVLFLPLTGTPYILWVVHKEGQEPEGYFKDTYAGHAGLMWVVRVFMMVVVSVLSSIAAIMILGAFRLVFRLFK